ncbi:FAD dependent oxidoreductase-like protein [Thozetella sp. PMI_491]|nr:FAD dependent oxidoreductase-like protein [Thozetella sp. PMI_491]
MTKHVVVLGAGVTGLSAATRLQEAGFAVTIVARDFPLPSETIDPQASINYTSPWGGAHNRWVLPGPNGEDAREHGWALETYRRMADLAAAHPEAGITWMKGIEYLEAPEATYLGLTEAKAQELGMEGFRFLRRDELPDDKVQWGCEYRTWCVNPMVYLMFLLRRFAFRGGKVVKRELRDPAEVFELGEDVLGAGHRVQLVVNASGNGFGDRNVFVTRGQTCIVANRCDATVTRQNADGSWVFSVPRNFDGGTIIGGTKEPNDWRSKPSLEVREKILRNFAATYPKVLGESGKFAVIRDVVGRRPTRKGGIRLERERVGDSRAVLHAYGLGGRGYELSWGLAQGVVDEVMKHLGPSPKL